MKAREMLKEWAEYAEGRDMPADAAALRELDGLLSEVRILIFDYSDRNEKTEAFIQRLAQAGYGEK